MMLTPKQRRFTEEYMLDLNATRAAIRAGYSERNADKIGSELLGKTGVAAAIDEAKRARSTAVGVDADYVLKRLHQEVEADLADLYDDDMNLKPVEAWPLVWRTGLVQGIKVTELFEGAGAHRRAVGIVKEVRLADRGQRLDLLGRHVRVNAFKDQIQVTGLEGLAERVARAKKRAAGEEGD